MNRWAKISYTVMSLAALALALTGIGEYVFGHPPMTHWKLIIHMTAAPFFALGLAAVALTWADLCRPGATPRLGGMAKALFWVVLACGLVVLLSGALPMTPFFGARGEHLLYLTHRYAGIALFAAVALHLPALRPPPKPAQ